MTTPHPVLAAVDAGHVMTCKPGKRGDACTCTVCGTLWPCAAIMEARAANAQLRQHRRVGTCG